MMCRSRYPSPLAAAVGQCWHWRDSESFEPHEVGVFGMPVDIDAPVIDERPAPGMGADQFSRRITRWHPVGEADPLHDTIEMRRCGLPSELRKRVDEASLDSLCRAGCSYACDAGLPMCITLCVLDVVCIEQCSEAVAVSVAVPCRKRLALLETEIVAVDVDWLGWLDLVAGSEQHGSGD